MENGTPEFDMERMNVTVQNIESKAQSRPIYKFGVLVFGVALGSYLGVGRHVARLNRQMVPIGAAASAQSALADAQRALLEKYLGGR